jgi:hypothetical protein
MSGTCNSFCKVLFILRSHYLCAIGLRAIFSLGRDIPAVSRCSPNQHYSIRGWQPHPGRGRNGGFTLLAGLSRELRPRLIVGTARPKHTTIRQPKGRRFSAEHFPARSPLRRESQLLSFPGLNDMLKFSPWSCCDETQPSVFRFCCCACTHVGFPLWCERAVHTSRCCALSAPPLTKHAQEPPKRNRVRLLHHGLITTWPYRETPRPPVAFEGLALHRLCNSYQVSPFAAFFIVP